jgi:tripartite-type tricarboxylate transporter receptor subunit TctC
MMKRISAAVLTAALVWIGPAAAQVYPAKPITIVVPFGAGGPADTLARLLAERMKATLGQSIVVENAPGAAGSIGVGRVVRAAPDGYTIGIGHLGTHVFNGALQNLAYDLQKDLEPIILLPSNHSAIVTKKDVPAKDLKELIAWLKANPAEASAATAGIGSIAHVASAYFQERTGVALRVVTYRGGEHPHRGRSRIAWALRLDVVWPLGAEGHAQGRHRQAQCCCCRSA